MVKKKNHQKWIYFQPEVTVYLVLHLSSFWLADVPVRGFSPGSFWLAKSIMWVTEARWEETLLCMLDGPINEDKRFLAFVLREINGSHLGDFEEQQPSEKHHRLKKTQLYHWTRNATKALLFNSSAPLVMSERAPMPCCYLVTTPSGKVSAFRSACIQMWGH